MSLTTTNQSSGTKSFWALSNTRPDSIVAKALLLAGGTAAAYYGLPILNTIVWNAVSISVGVGILAAGWFAIVDGRLIRLADYAYRSLVRLGVGFFVTLDPIGIMKSYLQDVQKTVREFSQEIGNLRGAIDATKEDRAAYQREYDEAMAYVQGAKRRNELDDHSVTTQSSMAERRRQAIFEVDKLLEQMQAILALLERYYNKSKAYRDDLKDNIDLTERKRRTLRIASSAFQKAAAILRGDTIGAEFYDAAVEAAKEQAGQMVGEMKQWVYESQDLIKVFEGRQAANVELALQRLEAKEKSGESLLLEYQPGQVIDMAAPVVPQSAPVARPSSAKDDVRRFMEG